MSQKNEVRGLSRHTLERDSSIIQDNVVPWVVKKPMSEYWKSTVRTDWNSLTFILMLTLSIAQVLVQTLQDLCS